MALIHDLQRKYPKHGFSRDCVSGLITFKHRGEEIRDPFTMEHRPVAPRQYGLDVKEAIDIMDNNIDVPEVAAA